jgi:uncharacterized membrane protein (UPF0136 family)
MSPIVGHVTLGLYSLLLAAGGVMGFVKARSKASLIAGVVSALAVLVALGISIAGFNFGRPLGLTLAIVMFLFFGYRYTTKNSRFMPNGLMALISAVVIFAMMDIF